jgi:hypothetical protein
MVNHLSGFNPKFKHHENEATKLVTDKMFAWYRVMNIKQLLNRHYIGVNIVLRGHLLQVSATDQKSLHVLLTPVYRRH